MASPHNIEFQRYLCEADIKDPGDTKTIRPVQNGVCRLVSAAGETRTIADPDKLGQELWLNFMTDGGDITVTFSTAYTETGITTFVFTDPGQFLFLKAVRISSTALAWRQVSFDLGGRLVNIPDAATYTLLTRNSGKTHVFPDLTATCTVALPAAALGLEYTFISKALAADASDWRFQVAESGVSFLGGLGFCDVDSDVIGAVYPNGSSNDFMSIITPGAGTLIYIINDGTNWIANGQVFSNTTPAFADT